MVYTRQRTMESVFSRLPALTATITKGATSDTEASPGAPLFYTPMRPCLIPFFTASARFAADSFLNNDST